MSRVPKAGVPGIEKIHKEKGGGREIYLFPEQSQYHSRTSSTVSFSFPNHIRECVCVCLCVF